MLLPSLYPKLFDCQIEFKNTRIENISLQSVYLKIPYVNMYADRTKTFIRGLKWGKQRLMEEANLNPLTHNPPSPPRAGL